VPVGLLFSTFTRGSFDRPRRALVMIIDLEASRF
jgi:hypothetical protein